VGRPTGSSGMFRDINRDSRKLPVLWGVMIVAPVVALLLSRQRPGESLG
jgi:hypothetical protein